VVRIGCIKHLQYQREVFAKYHDYQISDAGSPRTAADVQVTKSHPLGHPAARP
jgi:hypothetical protein